MISTAVSIHTEQVFIVEKEKPPGTSVAQWTNKLPEGKKRCEPRGQEFLCSVTERFVWGWLFSQESTFKHTWTVLWWWRQWWGCRRGSGRAGQSSRPQYSESWGPVQHLNQATWVEAVEAMYIHIIYSGLLNIIFKQKFKWKHMNSLQLIKCQNICAAVIIKINTCRLFAVVQTLTSCACVKHG